MQKIRYNQANQKTASGHQTAGQHIWVIVEFTHPLEDPLSRFLGNIRIISKSLRHRNDRNPKVLSNILHADSHRRHYTIAAPLLESVRPKDASAGNRYSTGFG